MSKRPRLDGQAQCSKEQQLLDFQRMHLLELSDQLHHRKRRLDWLPQECKCAICQDLWVDPCVLECGHIFCEACSASWLERQRTCPTCRRPQSLIDGWGRRSCQLQALSDQMRLSFEETSPASSDE